MNDYRRLRDRKLVQWALAYLAGAWLLLQLIGLLGDSFSWPQLVGRAAAVLLGVGFLAALVVAWYHGEKGSQRVGGVELLMLAGILVIAGAAVDFFARSAPADSETAGADPAAEVAVGEAAEQGSIAVLPFVNMSSDPEQEYFSDGLTEELLNVLAQLPELRVASRTSAFAFKGQDVGIDSIGRALHVAHVVEGSVRASRSQMRITAQLIDARTGYHLWSASYDRHYRDIFAIQDEISRAIVAALRLRLSGDATGGGAQLAATETADPEAHTLLLQGLAAQRLQTNAGLRRALELYRAAVARDRDYLQARARLAHALGNAAYAGLIPREAGYRQARLEAERVLAVDSANSLAHTVLGRIADWHDWNWSAAQAHYARALASNPNDANAHAQLAWLLMRLGQPERALAEARRALQLDPLAAATSSNLGAVYMYAGQFQQAITHCRNAVALAPDATGLLANLAFAYSFAGDHAAAIQTLERARTLEPRDGYVLSTLAYVYGRAGRPREAERAIAALEALPAVQRTERATAHMGLGETDLVFEELEKAVAEREDFVADLGIDPVYAPLRGDPRFQQLIAKIGLK